MSDALVEEEYKFCHQLLVENISILEKTEVYATGAVAASMVFSLAASDPSVAVGSALVPVLISGLGLIRWRGLDSVIGTLNDYLAANGPPNGWTAYYRQNRAPFLKRSRVLIWILLNIVSAAFAILIALHGPFGKGAASSGGGANVVNITTYEGRRQSSPSPGPVSTYANNGPSELQAITSSALCTVRQCRCEDTRPISKKVTKRRLSSTMRTDRNLSLIHI